MKSFWGFPKTRGTLFGVLIIRILLFRVLYLGPLFSETPLFLLTPKPSGGFVGSGSWVRELVALTLTVDFYT